MHVLLAGATGTLGAPLVRQLLVAGHAVTGITRTPAGATRLVELGAAPLLADVMNREGLLAAASDIKADAVIHELTDLKKAPIGHGGMTGTDTLRAEGTTRLLELAAQVEAHTFITQSIVFGYGYVDHGARTVSEADDFGVMRGHRFDVHVRAMASAERQAFAAVGVRGVALRYGLFYGADMPAVVGMLRKRSLPVASRGGVLPFVHHEDAAAATVAALERGVDGQAYNIVDDTPTTFRDFLTEVAEVHHVPRPIVAPGWVLKLAAPYGGAVLSDVSMRVSHEKATRELGWEPRFPSAIEGIRAGRWA